MTFLLFSAQRYIKDFFTSFVLEFKKNSSTFAQKKFWRNKKMKKIILAVLFSVSDGLLQKRK